MNLLYISNYMKHFRKRITEGTGKTEAGHGIILSDRSGVF